MKRGIFVLCILLVGFPIMASHTVSFTRVTVDSSINGPHGTWAGNIDGTSPQYVLDIFGTIGNDGKAVWYSNLVTGMTWSAQYLIWDAALNYEIAGADLNGNGTIDAVSCNITSLLPTGTTSLELHTNSGGGSFTNSTIDAPGSSWEGNSFRQMRLRDIDNDGDSDIIATVQSNYSASLYPGEGLYWYENNGSASFSRHGPIGSVNPWKVDCFDDRGDGHLNIVVSEFYHGYGSSTSANCRLIVYQNNGAENFSEDVIDNSFSGGSATGGAGVRCYDFDKDGRTDIVCGDISASTLYWYKNNGGGGFTRNTIASDCPGIDGIDIGDFNNDGNMDICVAGRSSWFRWYENNGTANFTAHTIDTQYPLFDLPYVSYFDGDTCPDIVLSEASLTTAGHIFAYLNPCSPPAIEEEKTIKTSYLQIIPNPANRHSSIKLQVSGITSPVILGLYDISGKLIKTLLNTKTGGITYNLKLDTETLTTGIYFVKLNARNYKETKKLILMK